MVALRGQETGGGRGLSGLHWVWCIGRGPHLQLRQEPQGTSDFRPSDIYFRIGVIGICLDFSEFSVSWSPISLEIIDFNKLKLLFYEVFNYFIYFASDLLPYYRIADF